MLRAVVLGACAVAAVFASAASAAGGGAVPSVKLKALPVSKTSVVNPSNSVVSRNGKTLYVADASKGLLAVNLTKPASTPRQIKAYGTAIYGPNDVVLSPDGKTLYVSGSVAGSGWGVYMVDVSGSKSDKSNGKFVGEILDPHAFIGASDTTGGLALSRNGRTLFVTVYDTVTESASIAVADLNSPRFAEFVTDNSEPIAGGGDGLTLSPSGKLLYFPEVSGPADVMVVKGNTVLPYGHLSAAKYLSGVAVSADGSTMYGTLNNKDLTDGSYTGKTTIETFALTDGGLHARLARSSPVHNNHAYFGIAFTHSGTTAYVTAVWRQPPSGAGAFYGGVSKFAIPAAATKVTVEGRDRAGSKLTAKVKDAKSARLAIQWYSNGKAIKGAHEPTLKITGKLAGKKISVKVTADAVGYASTSLGAKERGKVSG